MSRLLETPEGTNWELVDRKPSWVNLAPDVDRSHMPDSQ
jgi:hypothetical protein